MLMQAVAKAVFLFICVRLGLGLFGMDLYEIYWWFALGTTIALYKMNEVAEQKTISFVQREKHVGINQHDSAVGG